MSTSVPSRALGTMVLTQPLPAPCPADLMLDATGMAAFEAAYRQAKDQDAAFVAVESPGEHWTVKTDMINVPQHVVADSVYDAIRAAVIQMTRAGEVPSGSSHGAGVLRTARRGRREPGPRTRSRPVRKSGAARPRDAYRILTHRLQCSKIISWRLLSSPWLDHASTPRCPAASAIGSSPDIRCGAPTLSGGGNGSPFPLSGTVRV
ncbi:hypothetical protein [Streptomyces humi]